MQKCRRGQSKNGFVIIIKQKVIRIFTSFDLIDKEGLQYCARCLSILLQRPTVDVLPGVFSYLCTIAYSLHNSSYSLNMKLSF